MERGRNRSPVALAVSVVGLFVVEIMIASAALSAQIPITYDESWNYHNVSARGAWYALSSYEFPNNHILFSTLQSVLPAALVKFWPPALRILNLFCGLVFLVLLFHLLSKRFTLPGAAVGVVAVVFCSPLFTLYVFVARGYLAGTLLLLSAVVLAAEGRRFYVPGIMTGLAAACVPTFGLPIPAVAATYLFAALRQGKRSHAFAGAIGVVGFTIGIAAIFYLPKSSLLLRHSSVWRAGISGPQFINEVFGSIGNHSIVSVLVLAPLALALVPAIANAPVNIGHASDSAESTNFISATGLILACLSYVGLACLLAFLKIANPPFPRNGLFIPLFLWVALFQLYLRLPAPIRALSSMSAAANTALGVLLCVHSFGPDGDPNRYPFFEELSPTPAHGTLSLSRRGIRIDAIETLTPNTSVAASLYAETLSVPLMLEADAQIPQTCAAGRQRPPPHQTVIALSQGNALLICY